MTGFALLIPEALLLVGALVVLFADRLPGGDRGAAWIGAFVSLLAGAIAFFQPTVGESFGGHLIFDPQARFARVAIALLVCAWTLWVAGRGTGPDRCREAVSFALFSALGTMLVAEATELVTLFIAIELAAIPTYVLVGYNTRDGRNLEGALKYFLLSILTTLLMLYGFAYVYGLTGATFFSRIDLSDAGTVGLVAAVLAVTGLLSKLSAAPFHYWAPDAYEGAGAWAVGYASTVPKIGGAVALVRLVLSFGKDVEGLALVLLIAAIASMLLGNLAALTQNDIRRMMAYSGVGHAGYLLLGVATLSAGGGAASVFYAVAYAVPAMGIMLLAAEQGVRVDDWGGVSSRRPAAAWATLVFLLSLVGIPPLVGFFGKLYLFTAALRSGLVAGVVIAVVMSVVSAAYYLRIVRAGFYGETPAEPILVERSRAAEFSLGLLVVAVVAMGVAAGPLIEWASTILS